MWPRCAVIPHRQLYLLPGRTRAVAARKKADLACIFLFLLGIGIHHSLSACLGLRPHHSSGLGLCCVFRLPYDLVPISSYQPRQPDRDRLASARPTTICACIAIDIGLASEKVRSSATIAARASAHLRFSAVGALTLRLIWLMDGFSCSSSSPTAH